MALSHVCMGCGLDLAGERAAGDPHYRLPLVRCPRCGAVSARRPARSMGWRAGHRMRRAVRAIGLNVLALAVFAGFSIGLCVGFAGERTTLAQAWSELAGIFTGSPADWDPSAGIILGFLLAFSVGAGAWLAWGVGHVPRWVSLPGWAALLQIGAVVLPMGAWIVDRVAEDRWPIANASDAAAFGWSRRSALAAALAGAAAVAGVPIGRAGAAASRRLGRSARGRRRVRLRKRRQAE